MKRIAVRAVCNYVIIEYMTRYGLNITSQIVDFHDPITQEPFTGTVEEYIADDPENIVIMYNTNEMFLTTRNTIDTQYDNNNNRFFGCYNEDTALMPRQHNINSDNIYFRLQSIGFITEGGYCDMNDYITHTENQLFVLFENRVAYASYASLSTMLGEDITSGLHCQGGFKSRTSKLHVARPSTVDNTEATREEGGDMLAVPEERSIMSDESNDLEMSALIGDYSDAEESIPRNVTVMRDPGLSPIQGISDIYEPRSPDYAPDDLMGDENVSITSRSDNFAPLTPDYSPPSSLHLSDLDVDLSQSGSGRKGKTKKMTRRKAGKTLKKRRSKGKK